MPKFCSHGGAWRVKMHICTCFDTTASPNPCIILWDQLQKKDTIITISCGSFLSNTKKRKKSHLTSRLNQGLEESTTHNYQIQTVPCPSFALEEEEQSWMLRLGNDEILLWLLFLVWNSYSCYVLNGISYSIFLGMIRDEPIEPIVSHRFLFQLSHQDPRVAKWAQRWRRS